MSRARLSRCLGQFHALCAGLSDMCGPCQSPLLHRGRCGGWLRRGRLLYTTSGARTPISDNSSDLFDWRQTSDVPPSGAISSACALCDHDIDHRLHEVQARSNVPLALRFLAGFKSQHINARCCSGKSNFRVLEERDGWACALYMAVPSTKATAPIKIRKPDHAAP
jgi:hypothetical protein